MPGSERAIHSVNWQRYAGTFPERYLRPSWSDSVIRAELGRRPSGRALDVGGGPWGTRYLRGWASEYRLLDPHVHSILKSVGWEDLPGEGFDAVVARGSLNYLTEDEIAALAGCVRRGGLLAFNTFVRPTAVERRYVSKDGAGTERSELVAKGPFGMVEHTLEPDGVDWKIVHSFFHYPLRFLLALIEPAGLVCEVSSRGNTAVFLCRSPEIRRAPA